jgi:glycosyltransferase involved in cell wall biosynthesis
MYAVSRRDLTDRILIVVQVYPDGGGISSIVENYASELGRRFQVHVAIVDERPGRRETLEVPDERVHVLGYSNAINPLMFPTSVAYSVRVGHFLRRLITRLRPQVMLLQDGLNLPVPGLIATRRSRTRLVVMDHGMLTNVHDDRWLAMVQRRLGGTKGAVFRTGFHADAPWRALRWRLGVRHADGLWYTGYELEPWFGAAGSRARRYAQTVPADFTPPTGAERTAARRALGLGDEEIIVNSVGRLDGEKGLDALVRATSEQSRDQPWRLLVGGDGTLQAWLTAEIAHRSLEEKVVLLGRLDRSEVRRLQQASDYHVYAGTISCGVSICLLEAMASGVVPIVSDVPRAQRDLVGDSGWVFPAGDASALSSCLREALSETPTVRMARRVAVLERLQDTSAPTVPQLVEELISDASRGVTTGGSS